MPCLELTRGRLGARSCSGRTGPRSRASAWALLRCGSSNTSAQQPFLLSPILAHVSCFAVLPCCAVSQALPTYMRSSRQGSYGFSGRQDLSTVNATQYSSMGYRRRASRRSLMQARSLVSWSEQLPESACKCCLG